MAGAIMQLLAAGHAAVQTEISRLAGTVITDALSTWANVGAGQGAFNGVGVQTDVNSSSANGNGAAPTGTNYIGKDWGSGQQRRVDKIILKGPSNNSLIRGGTGAGAVVTATFDGSNDGSTWTTLDTFSTSGATSQTITRTTTITATTAYRYHRVAAPGNGVNGCAVAQFQMFETI